LSLTAAGVIHQHGPGEDCPRSGQSPVEGSAILRQQQQVADTKVGAERSSDWTDPEVLIDTLNKDRCRVLKRLPKASRSLVASKLASLLECIVANPSDPIARSNLLRFCYACFAVPGGHGGKRHLSNRTSKVNQALHAYPSII